jgi:hypothetical protein
MKPDGPTMSTEEIARWEAALKQRVVAQREHKERTGANQVRRTPSARNAT